MTGTPCTHNHTTHTRTHTHTNTCTHAHTHLYTHCVQCSGSSILAADEATLPGGCGCAARCLPRGIGWQRAGVTLPAHTNTSPSFQQTATTKNSSQNTTGFVTRKMGAFGGPYINTMSDVDVLDVRKAVTFVGKDYAVHARRFTTMNGLYLFSAFLTSGHPQRFTTSPHVPPFMHTHSHTVSGVSHARRQPARQERLG